MKCGGSPYACLLLQWSSGGPVAGLHYKIERRQRIRQIGPENSRGPQRWLSGFFGVRRGRLFTSADAPATDRVVVVNESLARRFFPDEDALGKRVTYDDPTTAQARWLTIVGIVAAPFA